MWTSLPPRRASGLRKMTRPCSTVTPMKYRSSIAAPDAAIAWPHARTGSPWRKFCAMICTLRPIANSIRHCAPSATCRTRESPWHAHSAADPVSKIARTACRYRNGSSRQPSACRWFEIDSSRSGRTFSCQQSLAPPDQVLQVAICKEDCAVRPLTYVTGHCRTAAIQRFGDTDAIPI